jgi:hypothetical protein
MSADTKIDHYTELEVTAFAFYDSHSCGFALPLLSIPGMPSQFAIQEVDEYSQKIRAYKILEWEQTEPIALPAPVLSKVGGDLIYVFVDTEGSIHCGSLQSIESALRRFAEEQPSQREILLQIFELVGSINERRENRLLMRKRIADQAGDTAARAFYERSTLRSALWSRLIAAAPDSEAATRIIRARSNIEPDIDSSGRITIDLSCISPADYSRLTLTALIDELQSEFNPQDEENKELALPIHESLQVGNVSKTLKRIKAARRLEERIAILLDELIKNPNARQAILRQYSRDKAVIATRMLKNVIVPAFIHTHNEGDVEFLVATLIPKLYTQEFPMQRGVLLFDLAKHLGKYRHINDAIRDRTRKSNAYSVQIYRADIDSELDLGMRKR